MNIKNAISRTIALTLATAAFMYGGAVLAQQADSCLGGVLQVPSDGADLVLRSQCTIKAGTYKFKDVHILANGVLTFEDANIDFWAANILIENGGSLIAGSPEAPIGSNGGTVTFHLWGKDQTGTNPRQEGIGVPCLSDDKGHCGIPDSFWSGNTNAMGMEVPVDQARKISELPGASDYPNAAGDDAIMNDYFYAYTPLMFDGAENHAPLGKGYFGYKVLGVSYGGSLQLFGKKGATYATPECGSAPTSSGSSWARLDRPVAVGASQLVVDRPLTLKLNDRIVVTTTDYLPGHSEEMTVGADVTCGTAISLKNTFKYEHNGTRFSLAAVPQSVGLNPTLQANGAEVRAAVGVLTRSIRIVSAGDTLGSDFPPEPPAASKITGYYFGGQVIARQGFKRFQIQGVEFHQMGQGGRMAHYPLHFHHTRRAPDDTFVRDSSIDESMTRWIVLHGAQNVRLERNVGYKSIGHGFYLEDGTETDNKVIANLGVFARAAVDNVQNPRKVPGILAAPDLHETIGENVPYRSDYDHPTVFWIMNGWNDFQDNMAVGAGTCGVCYWLLASVNSGMSQHMKWTSYASMQSTNDRFGMVPLKSFVGNTCSTAMTSFQTVTQTEVCAGVAVEPPQSPNRALVLEPIKNPLASKQGDLMYYPTIDGGGGHFPSKCDKDDCSVTPLRCSAGNPGACMVTVLDRYTTSFNWAPFNFAAIWLRPQWYLLTDSVITDVQQAGLTMVTGGGYSDSDVIPGHWALVRKTVFIGNTQENNLFASNGGPFSPGALHCALDNNQNRVPNYCLSADEGVSFQTSNFGMYQRLFSVYDGPAYQDSNAYLNIRTLKIDDCKPFVDEPNKVGRCDPVLSEGKPRQSQWLAGSLLGLPKGGTAAAPYCYMPNAAIGWKQPNGFYYPPAFHSRNLFFDAVDIRHFVVTPLVVNGGYETDFAEVSKQYCNYNSALFAGFAGNDRQTVLNDDDGTLTGYKNTTVINKDDFFAAPVDATECRSSNSSRTSPYEYVTTVLYPKCVGQTCARQPGTPVPGDEKTKVKDNDGDWNRSCTDESCYGVPLWRQDLMPIADKGKAQSIRMMGQATGQRGSLTANHGTYYIDTPVSRNTQLTDGCSSRDRAHQPCVINVFKPNETYYLFLIFAKPETEQTYRFFVGDNSFDPSRIEMVKARIGVNPIKFDENLGPLPAGRAKWFNNNPATGVVEVNLRLADLPGSLALFEQSKKDKCQPSSYCQWGSRNGAPSQCIGTTAAADDVCKWAGADPDCPAEGCFGIKFTLPAGFSTREKSDPRPDPRPLATCVAKALPWDISFQPSSQPYLNDACPSSGDSLPEDFCAR